MESDNKHLIVGGIQFQTEEEARDARLEIRQIKYLKTKINFENKEHVKKAYDKLVESQTFRTAVGQRFLDELLKYASGGQTVTQKAAMLNTLPPSIDSTSALQKQKMTLPKEMPVKKVDSVPVEKTVQATSVSVPKGPKPDMKTMFQDAFSSYNKEAPFHIAVLLNILQLIVIIVLIFMLASAYGKINQNKNTDTVSYSNQQVKICVEKQEVHI